ncbi:MAG: SDR family oxidoreductase [Muribaculaceae bacterium]|nr:SDR family oxidoreductase [Muribaculaceae bacterium]
MKTIFITGGATGIGAAAVRKFVHKGWNTAFMDIDCEAAETLVRSLNADGRVLFIEGNTRSRADIASAVSTAVGTFGQLDSIFANAGIHRRNTILDITDEELQLVIDTNIYGTVNTLREAVPHLIESGGGSIVINASDQSTIGKAHSFAYGLTKGALGQITKSLSIDLGPKGIRVNAVCPGTIRTPLVDRLFERFSAIDGKTVEQYWEEENALFARGSAGTPEEVAELVYFLASDSSSFCTGGLFPIDGGLTAM